MGVDGSPTNSAGFAKQPGRSGSFSAVQEFVLGLAVRLD